MVIATSSIASWGQIRPQIRSGRADQVGDQPFRILLVPKQNQAHVALWGFGFQTA
jgi:hypothetical protein